MDVLPSMKTPNRKRWPRLTNLPLGWEIALVLLVKLAIIIAIKKAFFSNPQAKKMLVPMPQVEQQFFSSTQQPTAVSSTPANGTPITINPQEQHGSH